MCRYLEITSGALSYIKYYELDTCVVCGPGRWEVTSCHIRSQLTLEFAN